VLPCDAKAIGTLCLRTTFRAGTNPSKSHSYTGIARKMLPGAASDKAVRSAYRSFSDRMVNARVWEWRTPPPPDRHKYG
jgi:hypothetical protein